MNEEISARWAAADAIVIATPTHWYSASSALKLMIDRLVCADGGNPDPTSTHGKKAEEAKALELRGRPWPKHLAGRVYGLVVHDDVEGVDGNRPALAGWLDWLGLVDAGSRARLGRHVGYWKPDPRSHDALDADEAVREEARQLARAVAQVTRERRAGDPAAAARGAVATEIALACTLAADRVRSVIVALQHTPLRATACILFFARSSTPPA